MFRSLLSCASIFVLLISTLFSPASVFASRCSVKMPVTLLSLYRNSQFIYVGTFDRIEEGEITAETAEYSVVPIKKSFSLSTSLKGETKKMLVLEESQYRYKVSPEIEEAEESEGDTAEDAESTTSVAEEAEPEAEGSEAEVDGAELKPGDRVLLFLNKDEDSNDLELSDYTDGLKKMSPEKLSAYEPRIRELNEIFSKAEPSYSEIVAWLVRCAEDPETRWEGTYELLRSFQYMDLSAERAEAAKQKAQGQEEDLDEFQPRSPKKFDTGDENFAKELTEGQKLLLTSALLNRKRPKQMKGISSEDSSGLNSGDRELIELVGRWGDSRVAINILEQLRYDASDSNLNTDLMESIASILNDDELSDLAERYSAIQWQDDDDEEEVEEQESDAAENDQSTADVVVSTDETIVVEFADPKETIWTEETADEVESSTDATAVTTPPKNEPKKKTYGEVKAELMKKFLDRTDRLIAEKEKAEAH